MADDIADYPGLTVQQQEAYKANIRRSIAVDHFAATVPGTMALRQGASEAQLFALSKMTNVGRTITPVEAALGGAAAGAIGGGLLGYAIGRSTKTGGSSRSSSRRRKRNGSPSRGARFASRGPRRGKRKTPRRNGPGGAVKQRYGGRKVFRTKRGQPYVLKANGQARFIKA